MTFTQNNLPDIKRKAYINPIYFLHGEEKEYYIDFILNLPRI